MSLVGIDNIIYTLTNNKNGLCYLFVRYGTRRRVRGNHRITLEPLMQLFVWAVLLIFGGLNILG
jgi:hypothetical protein